MYDRPGRMDGRRQTPLPLPPHAGKSGDTAKPALDDFAQYEKDRDDAPVNYRRRALMNVIAIAVVTTLVGAGVWIADIITNLERDQDCMVQGRSNCKPLELPAPPKE